MLSYDAWGRRRNPAGSPPGASYPLPAGNREFTAHETIPNVGLVNMNGRVYDAKLGRFLSPDPNVQFVANLQSYNRYTYALNNPLRYTDPTGYFISPEFDMFVNFGFSIGAALCPECAAGFAIAAAIYNATLQIAGGAAGDKVLMFTFVSVTTAGVQEYVKSDNQRTEMEKLTGGRGG